MIERSRFCCLDIKSNRQFSRKGQTSKVARNSSYASIVDGESVSFEIILVTQMRFL